MPSNHGPDPGRRAFLVGTAAIAGAMNLSGQQSSAPSLPNPLEPPDRVTRSDATRSTHPTGLDLTAE